MLIPGDYNFDVMEKCSGAEIWACYIDRLDAISISWEFSGPLAAAILNIKRNEIHVDCL